MKNFRKCLGIFLIVLPFISIGGFALVLIGVTGTLIVFGSTLLLAGTLALGVHLLEIA